jgi:FKBP-type peptidyl-prolyl cis-trans isomerase 2
MAAAARTREVHWGCVVSLDYDALLDSGEQIDSSAANGPLRFRVGDWHGLRGLGPKLVGLHAGDERLIRLSPAEAFGEWDPSAVLTMRQATLDSEGRLEDGMTLRVETVDGSAALCRVYRLTDERVALDFNHPLAGEPLTLFVRVADVAAAN